MGVHCFTSFNFAYLGRAKILAQTLRRANPDWHIWAVLVDEPFEGSDFEVSRHFDTVVYAKDLGIERFKSWMFKHDVVEACTAVKGAMLGHLFSRGASMVVYLDPDIAVFGSLNGIEGKLKEASIVLTPHQVSPNETVGLMRDNELTSLQYGVYNLGFIAVRNDATGQKFAEWWQKQLYYACYDDVKNGIFTDQKWCDLVPSLFDNVLIERCPGYNVATWNLSTRRVSFDDRGQILVNDEPLRFFHFTKVNNEGDIMIEKNACDNVEAFEIWRWYKRALAASSVAPLPKGYWAYGTFNNGVPIKKQARVLYRTRRDLMERFENPFDATGASFLSWLSREAPSLL